MADVFLHKRPNFLKARVLAPFLKRYRNKIALAELPAEIVPLASHSLLLSDGRGLFIKNSKAACTTICHKIYCWEHGRPYEGTTIHRDRTIAQGLWVYPRIVDALNNPDCLKFSLVRDPAARCVSGFTDFVLDQKNKHIVRHMHFLRALGLRQEMPDAEKFDIYLDYLDSCITADVERMDEHFRPQYFNLRPDLVDFGFIGRVENSAGDIAKLADLLGVKDECGSKQRQTRRNRSEARFVPTVSQMNRMKALYAVDYEWFS
jgi:hypothetical protein